MKKSNFIKIRKTNNNTIVCNLITGAIITLNENEYKNFINILENPNNSLYKNNEFYENIANLGFILSDYVDEIEIAKNNYWKEKFDKKLLNLTIVPTFDCNLDCSYCYQKGFCKEKMTYYVADKIYKYVLNKISVLEVVNICWFGGEPLLCIDTIIYLNRKIKQLCKSRNVQFNSSISTNSFMLNEKMIKKLIESEINEIQTTLAGTQEMHDMFRYTKNGQKTFDTVIKNIKIASKYWKIMICVNLTNNNIIDVRNLLKYLKENINNNNIYVTFNRIESIDNNPCKDICLDIKKYNMEVLNLFNFSINEGINVCDVTKFNNGCLYCAIDHVNSFGINHQGNVYKCTEIMDDNTKIGTINDEGIIVYDKFFHSIVDDPYNDDICRTCSILPYCNGGCHSKRVKGIDFCPSEKEYLDEYLELFCKLIEFNK